MMKVEMCWWVNLTFLRWTLFFFMHYMFARKLFTNIIGLRTAEALHYILHWYWPPLKKTLVSSCHRKKKSVHTSFLLTWWRLLPSSKLHIHSLSHHNLYIMNSNSFTKCTLFEYMFIPFFNYKVQFAPWLRLCPNLFQWLKEASKHILSLLHP